MSTFRMILAGGIFCLAIYLFVSAPAPLQETVTIGDQERTVKVENVFQAANAVNDAARMIYTKRIVGAGSSSGLAFSEDWAEPGVDKGPLPALFLRLAAQRLEAKPTRLSLYLGSDAPINKSNLFGSDQESAFEEVKVTQQAVFSESATGGRIGMFPDVASAMPCVTCHNEHEDSPKTDWVLGDIMGATTWTYPDAFLNAGDYLNTTEQLFEAIGEAYEGYLSKVDQFAIPVSIGSEWPAEGQLALPDRRTFMQEVREAASAIIVDELVLISQTTQTQ